MNEWIKCSDRLPLDWGMYLLCYYRDKIKKNEIQVIHFDNRKNKFNTQYSDDEPLFWMPLPEPPKDKS